MDNTKTSSDSIIAATQDRAAFSGHGKAMGAAGHTENNSDPATSHYLREPRQSLAISPGPDGFKRIKVSALWEPLQIPANGLLGKLKKMLTPSAVDIDIGCIYEMQDGSRGALQPFGKKFGAMEEPPYIWLSGDERSGGGDGADEMMFINGKHWKDIKRVLVYLYIYKADGGWSQIRPRVIIDVPGEHDLYVSLKTHNDDLPLCVVGGLENVRGGIVITNYTEYFPGHAEMDRAFGFGLDWGDGHKPLA